MGPLETFAASTLLAVVAGLVRLCGSTKQLTARNTFVASGYSGCVGLILSMSLWETWPDNPFLIISLAGSAGLMGLTAESTYGWVREVILRAFKINGGNGGPK